MQGYIYNLNNLSKMYEWVSSIEIMWFNNIPVTSQLEKPVQVDLDRVFLSKSQMVNFNWFKMSASSFLQIIGYFWEHFNQKKRVQVDLDTANPTEIESA